MNELRIVTLIPQHNFDSNELAIIRLGEDPENFDHYVLQKIESK